MMIEDILTKCDNRWSKHTCGNCDDCTYEEYCPHNCESCLDYIHNPNMRRVTRLRENMTAHVWQTSILANMLVFD